MPRVLYVIIVILKWAENQRRKNDAVIKSAENALKVVLKKIREGRITDSDISVEFRSTLTKLSTEISRIDEIMEDMK